MKKKKKTQITAYKASTTVMAVRLTKTQAHLILAKYGSFSRAVKENLNLLMAS
jgi:hypothetical protein